MSQNLEGLTSTEVLSSFRCGINQFTGKICFDRAQVSRNLKLHSQLAIRVKLQVVKILSYRDRLNIIICGDH